jgi:hypothetical protein
MRILLRIALFIIGIAIIYFYFSLGLYKLGVFSWIFPLIGLAFMGINIFSKS